MEAIERAKRGQSWRTFILERAAIDSSNEIHNKGINADALRGLCLEYDFANGRYPESIYEGFALLKFFLMAVAEVKPPQDTTKHTQSRDDVLVWKERLRELGRIRPDNNDKGG